MLTKLRLLFLKKELPYQSLTHGFYKDTEVEIEKTFSYLPGVVLSSSGIFTVTQKMLACEAQKAIFSLQKKLYNFVNVGPSIFMDLFDKMINPILCYGCEVWGLHDAKDIEKVHLKYCKNVLSVRFNTVTEMVYGELGRFPLYIIRYGRIIKYWY